MIDRAVSGYRVGRCTLKCILYFHGGCVCVIGKKGNKQRRRLRGVWTRKSRQATNTHAANRKSCVPCLAGAEKFGITKMQTSNSPERHLNTGVCCVAARFHFITPPFGVGRMCATGLIEVVRIRFRARCSIFWKSLPSPLSLATHGEEDPLPPHSRAQIHCEEPLIVEARTGRWPLLRRIFFSFR